MSRFRTELNAARTAIDQAEERHDDAMAVLNQMAGDLSALSKNVSLAIAQLKGTELEPPAEKVRLLSPSERLKPTGAKPATK